LDFRGDGSEFWWGVFSLCLSLSLCLVSLSRAAECNERSKRTTATTTTTTTATTPREKELRRKSLFFLTSVCFQLFPKSPKEDTRSTLYIIIALLPRFCASSSLPPLKEERVSEAHSSSLRARTVSFYQKFRKHLRKQRTKGC
jgi:hypothetical protein